jgi:hypothetical protein
MVITLTDILIVIMIISVNNVLFVFNVIVVIVAFWENIKC